MLLNARIRGWSALDWKAVLLYLVFILFFASLHVFSRLLVKICIFTEVCFGSTVYNGKILTRHAVSVC